MSREAIEKRVIRIVTDELSPSNRDSVGLETDLVDDLEADSFDLAELLLLIEEEFEIEVPDDDASRFTTVESIVVYIERSI